MKIRPLHDRMLVERLEEREVKKGGIIIPDTAKEKPQEAAELQCTQAEQRATEAKVALDALEVSLASDQDRLNGLTVEIMEAERRLRVAKAAEDDEAAAIAQRLSERQVDDGPRLARVQVRQAQAVAVTGVAPGTLESAIEKAREAFRRADPSDLRTRGYAQYIAGLACRDLGRIAEAIREFDTGADLFAAEDPHSEGAGLIFPIYVSLYAWRSEACAAMGDFDRALASADAALRMATEIGHPSSVTIASAWLGYVHVVRGDLSAALAVLERGLAISREHDLVHGIKANGLYLALTHLLLGDHARGLDHLSRALEGSTGAFDLQWTRYETVTASASLAAARVGEARAAVTAGLATATARNAKGHLAPLRRLDGEILESEGKGEARSRQ